MISPSTFFRYGIIGIVGIFINIGIFYVLYEILNIHYLAAHVLSDTITIAHNFLLNAFLNFKVRDALFQRFISYAGMGFVGLIASTAMLWFFVQIIALYPVVAKIIAIGIVVVGQYIFNAKFTFKQTIKTPNEST